MGSISSRQKEILEVAVRILAQEGIQNLTVKNISNTIGFSEAALYRHYDSKHKILLGILDMFEKLSEMPKDKNIENMSSLDGIELFLSDRYDKFTKNRDFAKVIFSEALFINEPELAGKIRDIMQGNQVIVEKFIIVGQDKGKIDNNLDSTSVFRTIIGSMRLLVTQWCYNNYSFDLKKEGLKLWENIKIMMITK